MASLADMTVTLGLDDRDFVNGINNAENSVKKFGSTSEKELTNTAKLFGTLKTALAGIAFGELISQSAKFGSDIVNTARSLQTSTEAVYAWRTAIGNAGGDLDNARDALIDLTQKMSEAITSGGDVLNAFNKIGVSIKDLQGKSNEDIMKAVVSGLANIQDGAERSRLALILMGEDVKNVDWRSVANDYDKIAASAKNISPALESARNAQKQFNETYNRFLEQITIAIPWDTLSSGLKSLSDNMNRMVGVIGSLTSALVGLAAISAGNFFIKLIANAGGLAAVFSKLQVFIAGTIAAFEFWAADVAAVTLTTAGLATAMGGLASIIAGVAVIGAALYAAFQILDSVVEALTGKDIAGWFDSLYESLRENAIAQYIDEVAKSLANLAGIDYTSEKDKLATEKQRADNLKKIVDETENWYDEASKVEEKQIKTSQLLEQQKKDIAAIHQQYRQQNEQTLEKLKLDSELIGATEEQKRIQTELMNIENQRQQVVQGLKDKIKDATDTSIINNYTKAIEDTNAAFTKQKEEVAGLIETIVAKTQKERLDNFTTEQRISQTQRIRDIQNEIGKVGLPLIEQKYKDIEAAATAAIVAQSEAEAKARGLASPSDLPLDVSEKITAAVRKQIDYEKESVKALEDATNAENKRLFGVNSLLDVQKQIRDVNREIAYSTMPAYEQISTKITADARERAQQEIEAENARRGYQMSTAEAQAYYDAANNGLEELIKKQQESYTISRQWNTGWSKAMNDYIENATDAAKVAERVFSKAMSGMEDMFVEFTKTGKFEWKSFVNSMVEELLRAQFRQTMASMFTGITGGQQQKQSSGGVLSNLFSGFFAEGGNIAAGRWGIVGEAGPEIVSGPANITPMKDLGGSSNNITYNINAVDAMSFKQMIAADPSFMYAVSEQGRRRLGGAR